MISGAAKTIRLTSYALPRAPRLLRIFFKWNIRAAAPTAGWQLKYASQLGTSASPQAADKARYD